MKSLVAPQAPKEYSVNRKKELLVYDWRLKPLAIAEWYLLHKQDQRTGEAVSEFIIELRCQAQTCSFGNFLEQALRDRLICGLAHGGTQKKLLTEKDWAPYRKQ